jgi:hypothetical protein
VGRACCCVHELIRIILWLLSTYAVWQLVHWAQAVDMSRNYMVNTCRVYSSFVLFRLIVCTSSHLISHLLG